MAVVWLSLLRFPFLSVKPLTSPDASYTQTHEKLDRQSGESHETDNPANIPLFPSSASLLAVVSRSSLLWDDDQRVTMMDDVGKGGEQDTKERRENTTKRGVNRAWHENPPQISQAGS